MSKEKKSFELQMKGTGKKVILNEKEKIYSIKYQVQKILLD